MFQHFKQFDFISKIKNLFHFQVPEALFRNGYTLIFSGCIFSEFVGMFFNNVEPLIEILYLDLLTYLI